MVLTIYGFFRPLQAAVTNLAPAAKDAIQK
jgi:hypothetical protein